MFGNMNNHLPEPLVLRGHEDFVITCLQFDGKRIVSGSDDNSLKIWSVANWKSKLAEYWISLSSCNYVSMLSFYLV